MPTALPWQTGGRSVWPRAWPSSSQNPSFSLRAFSWARMVPHPARSGQSLVSAFLDSCPGSRVGWFAGHESTRGGPDMGFLDFIKKQFIDIIQWTEDGDEVLAWRFPMRDME